MKKEQSIKIVKSLADELNICFHWENEFNILFPEEKLQYELYNEIAPNFFSYLSKFYFDYFILKISNMLDRTKMGSNENLSLYQLEMIASKFFPDKKEEIKNEIDHIKEDTKTILNARNKIIAHKDLKLTLNKGYLGKTEFTEIEAITSRMAKIINEVLKLLGEPQCSFIWLRDLHGATSLIQSLKQSSYYRDLYDEVDLHDRVNKIERESKYYKLLSTNARHGV